MMHANGLAKLIEELGELQQIAAKKLAFQHTDIHPDGAGSMKTRMEDEIADVIAAVTFVTGTFELDASKINARVKQKLVRFETWHKDPNS